MPGCVGSNIASPIDASSAQAIKGQNLPHSFGSTHDPILQKGRGAGLSSQVSKVAVGQRVVLDGFSILKDRLVDLKSKKERKLILVQAPRQKQRLLKILNDLNESLSKNGFSTILMMRNNNYLNQEQREKILQAVKQEDQNL
ncbi:hypothetical protein H5410_041503 [Solanum commersonii]|uniref:Uncharacterized protein n=1 Tax=Solanum commersonii TaxID=4109 RepID=A0A9J5XT44_SOLCO|nr:hypothetical protein H5410_041503 [Solanum commersonii]